MYSPIPPQSAHATPCAERDSCLGLRGHPVPRALRNIPYSCQGPQLATGPAPLLTPCVSRACHTAHTGTALVHHQHTGVQVRHPRQRLRQIRAPVDRLRALAPATAQLGRAGPCRGGEAWEREPLWPGQGCRDRGGGRRCPGDASHPQARARRPHPAPGVHPRGGNPAWPRMGQRRAL